MIDRFHRSELYRLVEADHGQCVSLLLPTHRTAPDNRQDAIRCKNLVQQAQQQLLDRGLRRPDAEELLAPVRRRLGDETFWNHQADGLAVFLSESQNVEFRLPRSFAERAVVDSTCYITPLLPLTQGNGPYFLLAISQNSCRMFRGDRYDFQQLEVSDLPHDLRSALGWWRERELNFRSYAAGPGAGEAMFHGHEEDDRRIDLTAYFRRVVKALHPLSRSEQAPLVFAGVESLFPIFRDVAGELRLIDEPVVGNPDRLSAQDLHQKSWPLVEPLVARAVKAAVEAVQTQRARSTRALAAILPAARDGLVETLLLAEDAELPGAFDRETGQVLLGEVEEPQDMLNLAAVLTLRHKGNAISIPHEQMPHHHLAAAMLRAPVESVATPAAT